jgi:hypothetical protein
MRFSAVVALTLLAACSGKKQQDEPSSEPPPIGSLVRGDGGVTAVITGDPSGMHLDDGVAPHQVAPTPPPNRPGRPIDVTLRSTPPGAQVAVDGTVIGTTPAYWSGMADGREHEFVFTARGYAIARYRFVPVASGVIHGRLDPIHEETDAGIPTPPPEVVPPRPPPTPSINPPAAPPTLVTDAGVEPAPPAPAPVPAPTPSAGSSGSSAPIGPQP